MVGVECTGEGYKCPECKKEFSFSEVNFKLGCFAWFEGLCENHNWFIAYEEDLSDLKKRKSQKELMLMFANPYKDLEPF